MADSKTIQREAGLASSTSQKIPASKFDRFQVHRTYYTSAGSKIGADILVPASLPKKTPCAVIVKIHGGFLITGSSLFPDWFSTWILDYAEEQSAVIVSPNYRLLPEVKGKDILEDMGCFWQWFAAGGCQQYLNGIGLDDIELDLDRLLLMGESAGAYLAIQSVLSRFIRPRALVTLHPMLDLKADHYTKDYEKPMFGFSSFPRETVDEFLADAHGRPPVTEADPPDRLAATLAAVQTGRYLEFLGNDAELFVLDRIRTNNLPPPKNSGGEPLLPPLFVMHGREDSAVPVDGTLRFLELLAQKDAATKIRSAIRPGDHGFDFGATLDESWLRDGLDFVASAWHGREGRI